MRRGLKSQISIVIVTLVSVISLTIAAGSLWQFFSSMRSLGTENIEHIDNALKEEMLLRITATAAVLAENLTNPLYLLDVNQIDQLLETTLHDKDVSSVEVYDTDGRLVHDGDDGIPRYGEIIVPALKDGSPYPADSVVSRFNEDHSQIMVNHPIRMGDDVLGGIKLTMSLARVNDNVSNIDTQQKHLLGSGIQRMLYINSISILALIVVAIFVSLLLARKLSKPLEQLAASAEQIGRGNFDVQTLDVKDGEIQTLSNALSDMSNNIKASNEKIKELAYRDSLTGLPNRLMFKENLRNALLKANQNETSVAILFLDLDGFKRINDALGHQTGDKLLVVLSSRISQCLTSHTYETQNANAIDNYMIARLGGDEFVIALTDLFDSRTPGLVAESIFASLTEPLTVDNHSLYVTASIGITIYPDHGQSVDRLLQNADTAMYSAKHTGKNVFQMYAPEMGTLVAKNLAIEAQLRSALDSDELFMNYQPVHSAQNVGVRGFEALIRWRKPDGAVIYPQTFLPVAENTGLILLVDNWVINEVCRQIKLWSDAGHHVYPVAINLSLTQFLQPDLLEKLGGCISRHQIEPNQIIIELTETVLMSNYDQALETLSALKRLDIKIALDDFGTGYSSLSRLQKLPIDIVKIDKSFIHSVGTDTNNNTLVAAMITMAHTLGKIVVAEGVEHASQLDFLRRNRCDLVQGTLIGAPINPHEVPSVFSDQQLLSA